MSVSTIFITVILIPKFLLLVQYTIGGSLKSSGRLVISHRRFALGVARVLGLSSVCSWGTAIWADFLLCCGRETRRRGWWRLWEDAARLLCWYGSWRSLYWWRLCGSYRWELRPTQYLRCVRAWSLRCSCRWKGDCRSAWATGPLCFSLAASCLNTGHRR